MYVFVCLCCIEYNVGTHTHTHTVSNGRAWGPIYLHAVEEEQRIGGRDKTKKGRREKEETAGNYGENPVVRTSFFTVPKDREDQFTIQMAQCVCV